MEDSDYKGIFSEEFFRDEKPDFARFSPMKKRDFCVKVVKRSNLEVFWTGTVVATSPKNAQTEFSKQYPSVRSQYDHSYALLISRQK